MVKKLLGSGEMKVVELHRALHVSPKYCDLLMKQQGTHAGLGNIMYKKMHLFFFNREEAGFWVPEVVDSDGNRMDESDGAEDDDDEAEAEVISIESDADNDPESYKENRPQHADEGTKYNCHQIRCKITRFLINEGMMIGNFIPKLGVPPKSFHLFMKQSGPHAGIRNLTYKAAHQFFVDREAAKPTKAKGKAKTIPTEASGTRTTQPLVPKTKEKAPTKSAQNPAKATASTPTEVVSSLPIIIGEEEGDVHVYATFVDIRRQIAAYLRRPGVTQASLCRALTACQGSNPDRFHGKGHGGPVQSVQLQSFLRKKGQMQRNTSKVFYTAYVCSSKS